MDQQQNSQLSDYIQQARASGMGDAEIREELLKNGWLDADIAVALGLVSESNVQESPQTQTHFQASPAEPQPKKPGFKKKKTILLTVVAILVLGGGYAAAAKFVLHTWPFIEHISKSSENLGQTDISSSPSQSIISQPPLAEGAVKKIGSGQTYSCIFSPNYEHIACSESQDKKTRYVIDGKLDNWYENIYLSRDSTFSFDGKRFAYLAKQGDKYLIIIDGREGKLYDSILSVAVRPLMRFSPDGKNLVYIANKDKKNIVVVNDEESMEYDEIVVDPIFSLDSKRIAYGVKHLKNYFVVVDGQVGKSHTYIPTNIVFSPDSSQYVYIAQDIARDNGGSLDLNRTLVLNGQESTLPVGNSYNIIPTFSPDSYHLAYIAERNKKNFVILDGKEGKQYDWVIDTVFSPDSKRLAYVAGRDKKQFIVVDGVEDNLLFDEVGKPVFSPDSQHIAYRARIGDEGEGGKMVTVVDGQERKPYDYHSVGGGNLSQLKPVFSPDSKHVAYIAWVSIKQSLGKLSDEQMVLFKKIYGDKELPREIEVAKKEVVVVDDKEGKQYDSIQSKTFNYLQFSPDSQNIVYAAVTNQKQNSAGEKSPVFIVINDSEKEPYDDIFIASLNFNQTNNSASYVVNKGNDYYQVEQPL